MTEYVKEDDYTLCATSKIPNGGYLSRYFNFASEEVTAIYTAKHDKVNEMEGDRYGASNKTVSTSVSAAIAVEMKTLKFSDFDSQKEINFMRKLLIEKGGSIPEDDSFDGKPRPVPRGLG